MPFLQFLLRYYCVQDLSGICLEMPFKSNLIITYMQLINQKMPKSSSNSKYADDNHTKNLIMKKRLKGNIQAFNQKIPQQKKQYDKYNTQLYKWLENNKSRTQAVIKFACKHNFWYNQKTGKTQIPSKITLNKKLQFMDFLKCLESRNLADLQKITKLNQLRRLNRQLGGFGQDISKYVENYVNGTDYIKGKERKGQVIKSVQQFLKDLVELPQTQMVLPNYFPLPEKNNKPSKFSNNLYEFKQSISTSESAQNIPDYSDSFFGLINPNNSKSTSLEYQLPNFRQRQGLSKVRCFGQQQGSERPLYIKSNKDSSFNLDAPDEYYGPKFPQLTKYLSNIWKPQMENDQKLFAMDIQTEEKVNQTPLKNTNFNNLSHNDNNNINMGIQTIQSIGNDELGNFVDQVMYWQKEF